MAEAAPVLRVSREYTDIIAPEMLEMADELREDFYDRSITDEERAAYGEQVIELSSRIEDKTEEKKAMSKMLGDEIKAAGKERRDVLATLKRKVVSQPDTIRVFKDFDNLRIHEYNSKGERTLTRRMRPEERQTQITE